MSVENTRKKSSMFCPIVNKLFFLCENPELAHIKSIQQTHTHNTHTHRRVLKLPTETTSVSLLFLRDESKTLSVWMWEEREERGRKRRPRAWVVWGGFFLYSKWEETGDSSDWPHTLETTWAHIDSTSHLVAESFSRKKLRGKKKKIGGA
jgi:hypothetical protein